VHTRPLVAKHPVCTVQLQATNAWSAKSTPVVADWAGGLLLGVPGVCSSRARIVAFADGGAIKLRRYQAYFVPGRFCTSTSTSYANLCKGTYANSKISMVGEFALGAASSGLVCLATMTHDSNGTGGLRIKPVSAVGDPCMVCKLLILNFVAISVAG
jgi:hypothetical protein